MVSKLNILILFLLIIPGVLADTTINVRTLSDHTVHIQVLDSSQVYLLLNSYHLESGPLGEVSVVYSGTEPKIEIRVQITKDSVQTMFEKLGTFDTGSPIYIQMLPGAISTNYKELDESVNTTAASANSTGNLTENNTSESISDSVLSGNVAKNSTILGVSNKTIYFVLYVIAGILGLFLIVKFGVPMFRKDSAYQYEKMRINPAEYAPQIQTSTITSSELKEAEKKIQEAQAKIDKLKKIQDAENKLRASQDELNKLRSEK